MGINGQQPSENFALGVPDEEPVEPITLSYAFEKLIQLHEEGTITSFMLTRTTMAEVFSDFAKFQINNAAQGN